MNVLNLKESRNSLISRLKYLRSRSPNSTIVDQCNSLMTCIETSLDSFAAYKQYDIQIEELNTELGDLFKDYDPFNDDELDDIEDVEESEDSLDELEWWEIEDKTEKKQTIRFSLPDLLESVEFLPFETMKRITRRLDLNNRIRKQRVTKEITDDLKDRLVQFIYFCDGYMDKMKWLEMRTNILKREKSELYDDFVCNRINQQINECCNDIDYDLLTDIEDIEDIDSLERLSEINKKVEDLQHSNIIKIAIIYRIKSSWGDVIDEIEDLYDLIITSEMNYYRINLLKILLDEAI